MVRRTPDAASRAIGERWQAVRREVGLSQDALVERMEASPDGSGDKSHISDIERGVTSPTLDTVARVAEAMRVRPYELALLPDQDPHDRLASQIWKLTSEEARARAVELEARRVERSALERPRDSK